jgi:[acyl-carrier-protein] S-malonyltransferase
VSIAAHSPLMMHAQNDFNLAVEAAPMTEPHTPLVGNVTASPLRSAAEIRTDLQGQLTNRVRWTESVQVMVSQGVTTFIELGSGTVLGGLIKRIAREATSLPAGTPADFEKLQGLPEV